MLKFQNNIEGECEISRLSDEDLSVITIETQIGESILMFLCLYIFFFQPVLADHMAGIKGVKEHNTVHGGRCVSGFSFNLGLPVTQYYSSFLIVFSCVLLFFVPTLVSLKTVSQA